MRIFSLLPVRLFLIVLAIGLAAPSARAQKEVLYSQYLINPLSINPAYAGSRESFYLTALLRRKWISARFAPVTQVVSMDGAVANGRVGLGFQALNDRMGLFAPTTGIYGSVAYRFNLPALAKLSIGVSGGVSVLPFVDLTSASRFNTTLGSFGVGIYYRADRFFAGLSAPELAGRQLGFSPAGGQTAGQYASVRPVMLQAGMSFPVGENAVLIPSVLVSYIAGRPLGADLNARLWLNERVGFGLSYRQNSPGLQSTNYLHALAEYQLTKSIRVGYQFYSQTPESPNARQFNETSVHEVQIRFSPNVLRFSY